MRTKFILTTLLLSACTSTAQLTQAPPTPTPKTTGSGICGHTVSTTAPFYLSNSPSLNDENHTLQPPVFSSFSYSNLQVSGYVYSGTQDPQAVPNATLEIWQPDPTGTYYPAATGSATDYPPDALALRGTTQTATDGAYLFTAIYSNHLETPTRPIHIRISTPEHEPLTTTLLIPGTQDPNLQLESEAPEVCHLLTIYDDRVPATATYHFYLKKS